MSVLITGGAGYIGSHVAVVLMEAGYEVIIADDFSNSRISVIDRIQEIAGARPACFSVNVQDKAALGEIFAQNHIAAVMHLAGSKYAEESVAHSTAYYRNNLVTTLSLIEIMQQYRCKTMLFASSAAVYGKNCAIPLREESAAGRDGTPYASSKRMNEQILCDLCREYPGFSVLLLRYFNPIGAHPSGRMGETANPEHGSLMSRICEAAAGGSGSLEIFGDAWPTRDGTCERDYIHIMDIAEAHLAALRYAESHTGAESLNIGCGKGVTVKKLVRTFCEVNHVEVPYFIGKPRETDLPSSVASIRKSSEMLRWTARRNLSEMCRDAWRWQCTLSSGGP